jgi:hypothetical protein
MGRSVKKVFTFIWSDFIQINLIGGDINEVFEYQCT